MLSIAQDAILRAQILVVLSFDGMFLFVCFPFSGWFFEGHQKTLKLTRHGHRGKSLDEMLQSFRSHPWKSPLPDAPKPGPMGGKAPPPGDQTSWVGSTKEPMAPRV